MSTTFEDKSAKEYGTPEHAGHLRHANPGDNLADSRSITPSLPDAPADKPHQTPANDLDEVALIIDGTRYRYWSQMSIKRELDSVDTLTIKAPFDSEVPEFRKTFKPFSYKEMAVTVGGEPLFKGTMVTVDPSIGDNEKTVNVSGYAKCGVLGDVTPSASSLPVEFNKLTLEDIAAKMVAPFGVSVVFKDSAGAPFERVACDPSRKILEFLTELAQERALIMTSDPDGNLVFLKSKDSAPVARFEQGVPPLTGVSAKFDPQNYFSHITGIESSTAGKQGKQFTVKNPHVTEGVRPLNFSVTNTEDKTTDIKEVTQAKAGRMIGNMANFDIEVATWRDSAGKLWAPGDMVTLIAPDVFIYNEFKFIIRAVDLSRDFDSKTASLELAMPGAFSGEIPEALPWDE